MNLNPCTNGRLLLLYLERWVLAKTDVLIPLRISLPAPIFSQFCSPVNCEFQNKQPKFDASKQSLSRPCSPKSTSKPAGWSYRIYLSCVNFVKLCAVNFFRQSHSYTHCSVRVIPMKRDKPLVTLSRKIEAHKNSPTLL